MDDILSKEETQINQVQELWAYINELEQELIDSQYKLKAQKEQTELDISVCLGGNEAVKAIKSKLES